MDLIQVEQRSPLAIAQSRRGQKPRAPRLRQRQAITGLLEYRHVPFWRGGEAIADNIEAGFDRSHRGQRFACHRS